MRQVVGSVVSNTELMPDTHLLWLRAPDIAGSARPGQFVMVRCGAGDDPLLRRPLSVHRTAGGEEMALLFRAEGRGTSLLSRYEDGDNLDVFGPLGNGFRIHLASRSLLLVAGGIGIAPLVFLAQEASNRGLKVHLVMGAQDASLLYPEALLPSSVDLLTVTEDGSQGMKGVVTDYVGAYADQADQVFACGPASMYRYMAQRDVFGITPVQVALEQVMGCGLGACYGCTIETGSGLRQVCRDGPIFELDDVSWAHFQSLDKRGR